ncbi:MAG: response regulator [Chloroflexi bacterium]|nr:response regulator [Chloroflexota bacterium]
MPRILVVENEANVRKLVRANLTASGYSVLLAADGEEGLKQARLQNADLILLDLMMPGMSGWDVLEALKARQDLQKIPVIIMTAAVKENQEDGKRANAMGAAGYLSKPFTIDELLRQVRQALKRDGDTGNAPQAHPDC